MVTLFTLMRVHALLLVSSNDKGLFHFVQEGELVGFRVKTNTLLILNLEVHSQLRSFCAVCLNFQSKPI